MTMKNIYKYYENTKIAQPVYCEECTGHKKCSKCKKEFFSWQRKVKEFANEWNSSDQSKNYQLKECTETLDFSQIPKTKRCILAQVGAFYLAGELPQIYD